MFEGRYVPVQKANDRCLARHAARARVDPPGANSSPVKSAVVAP